MIYFLAYTLGWVFWMCSMKTSISLLTSNHFSLKIAKYYLELSLIKGYLVMTILISKGIPMSPLSTYYYTNI